MRRFLPKIYLAVLLIALGFIYLRSVRLHRPVANELSSTLSLDSVLKIVADMPRLKSLTLGYDQLYADALSAMLTHALTKATPAAAASLIPVISKTAAYKPRNEQFYLSSCRFLANVAERPEECLQITMLGLAAHPQSWRLPLLQAYVHKLKLNQPAEAASFYALAGSRKLAPSWVSDAAKKWSNNVHGKR